MKNLLILLTCLLIGFLINIQKGYSQTDDNTSIVEKDDHYVINLKSGTKLAGEIIEWDQGSHLVLKTSFSDNFRIEASEIKNVTQQNLTSNKNSKLYTFKDKGVYYSAKAQVISGNNGNRARKRFGYGLAASAGYRFNRYCAVGAGVGFDQYIYDSGENIIPIFIEYTSFFNRRPSSLYINVQAGYGLAITNEDFLITEAKGGTFIYPTVGMRFGCGPSNFTLDIGYKFQNADFTYADPWNIGSRSEQQLTYKRLCLRFGLLM